MTPADVLTVPSRVRKQDSEDRARAHENSNDFEDRFRHHFPWRSNDVALVVLKGHLLLEESVNHLLEVLLHNPEAIEGANLRFHQKLCLIRALLLQEQDWLNAAEKLNAIRNKLAHRLDPPQIEAQVRDFLSLCEGPEEPDGRDTVSLIRRLKHAIAFMCGAIEGFGDGRKAVRDFQSMPRTA